MQYGIIPRAAEEDPNGFPGQTRGGVAPTVSMPPPVGEYNGGGPAPYPQTTRVDPLLEAENTGNIGPEV